MLKRIFIVFLFLAAISTGCKKEITNGGVPNVAVSFTHSVYDAGYTNLQVVGGWVYVSGGYDGILLFRNSVNTILAFDRICPYDCTTNSKAIVTVQSNNIFAICPVCGTQYYIYTGAISNSGAGTIALKQYSVNFDGTNFTVSN